MHVYVFSLHFYFSNVVSVYTVVMWVKYLAQAPTVVSYLAGIGPAVFLSPAQFPFSSTPHNSSSAFKFLVTSNNGLIM